VPDFPTILSPCGRGHYIIQKQGCGGLWLWSYHWAGWKIVPFAAEWFNSPWAATLQINKLIAQDKTETYRIAKLV